MGFFSKNRVEEATELMNKWTRQNTSDSWLAMTHLHPGSSWAESAAAIQVLQSRHPGLTHEMIKAGKFD